MNKIIAVLFCLIALTACDKHDPILPGVRTAIFDTGHVNVLNLTIPDLPDTAVMFDNSTCPYTLDSNNVIWDGTRRIFSGFSTPNTVAGTRRPVCVGKYVIAGLTTGEVVAVNPKNRQIAWIADVYRPSDLTGGASMVDIVAPIVPDGGAIYAGGLGNAFCKLSIAGGVRRWCVNIGTGFPFVIVGEFAFVMGTDGYLYAIRTTNGDVYWRTRVPDSASPTYSNGIIDVNGCRIDALTGKIISK